jgi:hypothetical protein
MSSHVPPPQSIVNKNSAGASHRFPVRLMGHSRDALRGLEARQHYSKRIMSKSINSWPRRRRAASCSGMGCMWASSWTQSPSSSSPPPPHAETTRPTTIVPFKDETLDPPTHHVALTKIASRVRKGGWASLALSAYTEVSSGL